MCKTCPQGKYAGSMITMINMTGRVRLIFNTSIGATSCSLCPTFVLLPAHQKFRGKDMSEELCNTSELRDLCRASPDLSNIVDLYVDGLLAVDEQEIPNGCSIERTSTDHNNPDEVCKGCRDIVARREAAAFGRAAAATASMALVVVSGAAVVSGGASPALIDQMQFNTIIGSGASFISSDCCC